MTRAGALSAVLFFAWPLWAAEEESPSERPRLVILNFKSDFDEGDMGQRTGYSLRAKLRRSDLFAMPDELDFDDLEARGAARPALGDDAAAERLAEFFGPRFVTWGEVKRDGGYTISLRAVDLAGDNAPVALEKRASDLRQYALLCGELADDLAKALTGQGWREGYPSKSTEGYMRTSGNLVANGDFEKGGASPENWEKVDGLCSFWERTAEHGRYVRFDTDVNLDQWQDWRRRFDAGEPASAAPEKAATPRPKYDTVAGTYGVHLYSDPVAVKPGATYSVEFDARGQVLNDFFFAKVFVKGYGAEGATMEYYNMYKAVRAESPERWQHFSRIFNPTERTPKVASMRVMLFAYWPPGEYAFDNVAIYEVKAGGEAGASKDEERGAAQ